jgi:exopolyphosphatase/guanosine-5'-triphosphate,3'-diphosphate pyrophosphatase
VKKKRLAAIDIGTNSIRSIVVEANQDGTFRVLDDEKATVRLGDGLHRTGVISPDSRRRALEALARFCKITSGYGVERTEAIATSAVRKAVNGAEFIREVAEETGLAVSVVTGEEEAELAALSAFNNFDLEGNRHLLADLGGGSLELVTTVGRHLDHVVSLELGAVYLTETFLSSDPVKEDALQELRRHIRRTLRQAFPSERPVLHSVIGSGGTLTAIAAMVAASRGEAYGSLHGYELLHADVVHLLAMLSRTSLAERRSIPGLNPDRADIIVAGVAVMEALLDFCRGNLLKINERGIREGLILRTLHRNGCGNGDQKRRTWRDAALDFAASCHYDAEHSLHVTRLAGQIFSAVAEPYRLGERERQLLEAAAILHDIGYFINYAGHHKHSYHLIRHAELFGFTPRERELVAQIARYHRKALPKIKHPEYQRLIKTDRLLVSRLGGILRVADGLDRRRTSQVTGLDLLMGASRVTVRLRGDGDLSVELYGAKAKGELFERAFSRRLVLEPPNSYQVVRDQTP